MEIRISLVGFKCNSLCIQKGRTCQLPAGPVVLSLLAPLLTVPPPLLPVPHVLSVPGVGSAQCSALTVPVLAPLALLLILSNILSPFLFVWVFFFSF